MDVSLVKLTVQGRLKYTVIDKLSNSSIITNVIVWPKEIKVTIHTVIHSEQKHLDRNIFFQNWPKISNQYKIMKKSKAAEVPKPRETVTLSEDRIDQFRETFAGEMWKTSLTNFWHQNSYAPVISSK